MRNKRLMELQAVALFAGLALAADAVPTLRSAGSGNNRRPTPPRMDTELAVEIAKHNAAVELRKAEKKERKRNRNSERDAA